MNTKRAPRPYFLLAVREDGRWTQQFGDFDRETVDFERDDYLDHDYKARDLKIVRAPSARQVDCDAAIAKLNA